LAEPSDQRSSAPLRGSRGVRIKMKVDNQIVSDSKACKEAEPKDEPVPPAIRARPVTQYIRQDVTPRE